MIVCIMSIDDACDVAVVGGGPSGLQFAIALANQYDGNIAVLESNNHISENQKSTGGTFEPLVDGYDIPNRAIMSSNEYVTFETPNEQSNIPIRNYVLEFPKFLDVLASRARERGVEIKTDTKVEDPILVDDCVTGVRTQDGRTIESRVTVDATGPRAQLTDQLGLLDRGTSPHMVGLEYEADGSYENEEKMLFHFNHEYAPGGYAWTFPAGDNIFKIGVCWVKHHAERFGHDPDLNKYLDRWVEEDYRWTMEGVRDLHSGDAYTRPASDRRSYDGLVAVGDAVATINPMLGEGIRPGMESSDMAASVVRKALDRNDTSRNVLAQYDQAWNKKRGMSWRLQQIVTRLLYQYTPEQQDEFVKKTKQLDDEELQDYLHYRLGIMEMLPIYPFRLSDLPDLGAELTDQLRRLSLTSSILPFTK